MNKTKKSLALISLLASASISQAGVETLVHNNQLEFSGLNNSMSYQLKLRLPNGEFKDLAFNKASAIQFSAADFAIEGFADGQYKYELVPVFKNQEKLSRDHKAPTEDTVTDQPAVLSGFFAVKNGSTVIDQDEGNSLLAQVIPQDLIVQGSECIGLDCVNGESFGFDTLRLKENNLRIRFMDTSNSASFPTNDWELTANETSNGGANKFSITDIDGGRVPFTIEAGARSHSLYVDNGGRVGFGTSNPVVEAHITDGDTPTVRLEQNGSNGWQPQTWDVAGNETNFFIRDVTNGSKLPFSVRPNSPTRSIDIQTDGVRFMNGDSIIKDTQRMGIGTLDPQKNLHIKAASGSAAIQLENDTTGSAWKFVNKNGSMQIDKIGSVGAVFIAFESGAVKMGNNGANSNFNLESNGNLTISGALTQNSDVNSKENIQLVNPAEILDKVMELPISIWNYKFDDDSVKHLGPMAQDFFKQFNLGKTEDKIATIDTSGVALASIKALGERLNQKDEVIAELKERNETLSKRLEKIEQMLELKN